MKVFKVILGVCLGVLALYGADATAVDDVARAALRSTAQNIATSGARTNTQNIQKNATVRQANSRETERDASASKTVAARTTAKARTTTPTVGSRGAQTSGNVISRPGATPQRTVKTTAARAATRTATRQPATPIRGAVTSAATRQSRSTVRAATNESGVRTTGYQKCREIYYDCMDEFCANKDANLRRCACSARASEFDGIKKQMAQVEDKMLDFNQRLLMVNMDAEDVDAINTSTIGEDTFYAAKDKTKSKQTLTDISKKLNTAFEDENSGGISLAPIALSLNSDSAFDSVDSLLGAQTTTKSGVSLYNAALPVCREMAMEVCTDEEFALATSGYQMQIEQDCNTVFKAYQSQVDNARTKVFESSALLDISRLDAYQTRNSDDILTCKKKMLDLLTDNAVCGANMEKCLDITGRYIDPTTGNAFLTANLSDLDTLIARPEAGQTWTSVNSGNAFLTYLKNKKTYLESATKNCQDIADKVWDAFIEDALAQIKLAQGAKLEEIRQSCTTLTAECLTNASDSISAFDTRALSTFGISATRTAITMCAEIQNACSVLLDSENDTSWSSGIADANTIKTYDSIISSCNLVGQNCIIQACRSISGNFGLCEDIQFSANRHAILERTSCWNEVLDCVASAGDDLIMSAIELLGKTNSTPKYAFYDDLYTDTNTIYDICNTECSSESDDITCAKCRIAERIWGNCEYAPSSTASDNNRILTSENVSTLLMWFAKNTNTLDNDRSCLNVRCTAGDMHMSANGMVCVSDANAGDITGDGKYCPTPDTTMPIMSTGSSSTLTNCCFNSLNNTNYGNGICCENARLLSVDGTSLCVPSGIDSTSVKAVLSNNTVSDEILICIGANNLTGGGTAETGYPNGRQVHCNGTFIKAKNGTKYSEPSKTGTGNGGTAYTPKMYYYDEDNIIHILQSIPSNFQSWFVGYDE